MLVLDAKISTYRLSRVQPLCADGDPVKAVSCLFSDAGKFFEGIGCKAGCFIANIGLEMADVNEQFALHIDPATYTVRASVPGYKTFERKGIRIGSARDGSVTAFIPDPVEKTTSTSAAEGVAADAMGSIYGAEVGPTAYGPDAAPLGRDHPEERARLASYDV